MGNEIKRLLPRHFAILRGVLSGLTNVQIAENLKCTPQSVGMVVRSPIFQQELSRQRGLQQRDDREAGALAVLETKRKLQEASSQAADKLIELLDAENEGIQLKSANSILDRIYDKNEKSSGPVMVLAAEQIQLLQVAILESNEGREGTSV